eukprot:scaffold47755_cov40-Phaeocystis_antarctica.AAC.1
MRQPTAPAATPAAKPQRRVLAQRSTRQSKRSTRSEQRNHAPRRKRQHQDGGARSGSARAPSQARGGCLGHARCWPSTQVTGPVVTAALSASVRRAASGLRQARHRHAPEWHTRLPLHTRRFRGTHGNRRWEVAGRLADAGRCERPERTAGSPLTRCGRLWQGKAKEEPGVRTVGR